MTRTPYDIDDALADSFPASDPPAWTLGVARVMPPGPAGTAEAGGVPRSPEAQTPRDSKPSFAA